MSQGGEGGERLQKVLAQAGLGSRRACEALIEAGRVEVNGEVATLGRRVDPEHDRVTVDGVAIPVRPGLVYYLLNKPPRVMTTAHDPEGRPTVVDLVPSEPRVFPVGRLDWDTEGLLLLTNDGPLAHGLTHPSQGVPKAYLAEVAGIPGRAALRRLREESTLTTAAPPPPRSASPRPPPRAPPSRSSSTRVATARCGGCARRWATPHAAWCVPASGRCAITRSRRVNGGRLHKQKFERCTPPFKKKFSMPKGFLRFEISLVK